MLSKTPCTKCTGQVLERNGFDGDEKLCLNCGFSQVATIVATEALGNEAILDARRDRNIGWVNTYANRFTVVGKRNRSK